MVKANHSNATLLKPVQCVGLYWGASLQILLAFALQPPLHWSQSPIHPGGKQTSRERVRPRAFSIKGCMDSKLCVQRHHPKKNMGVYCIEFLIQLCGFLHEIRCFEEAIPIIAEPAIEAEPADVKSLSKAGASYVGQYQGSDRHGFPSEITKICESRI